MYFKIFNFIKRFISTTFRFINKLSYFIRNILKIIVLLIIIYSFIKLKGWL